MKKLLKRILISFLTLILLIIGLAKAGVTLPINKNKIFSDSKESGISCYKDNSSTEYKYKECDKFNVSDWVRYLDADNNDDKIVVWLDGGPMPTFDYTKQLWPNDNDLIKQMTLEEKPNFDFAIVKEIWHMKHALLVNSMKISPDDARKEQTEYMQIVNKIVKHYQEQGRKVVLAGHSYGGNQIQDFLRVNGTTPDGILSLSGRIAGPKSQADLWEKRIVTNYKEDNSNNDGFAFKTLISLVKMFQPEEFLVTIFDGATLSYDYTKAIDPKKLTHKNIIWQSSEGDLPAGSYTQKEKDFAKKYGKLQYFTLADVEKEWIKLKTENPDIRPEHKYDLPHNIPFWGEYLIDNFKELFEAA